MAVAIELVGLFNGFRASRRRSFNGGAKNFWSWLLDAAGSSHRSPQLDSTYIGLTFQIRSTPEVVLRPLWAVNAVDGRHRCIHCNAELGIKAPNNATHQNSGQVDAPDVKVKRK